MLLLGGVWNKISMEAKDFIQKLIRVNPNDRLTASQCLQHPWLLPTELSTYGNIGTANGNKTVTNSDQAGTNTCVDSHNLLKESSESMPILSALSNENSLIGSYADMNLAENLDVDKAVEDNISNAKVAVDLEEFIAVDDNMLIDSKIKKRKKGTANIKNGESSVLISKVSKRAKLDNNTVVVGTDSQEMLKVETEVAVGVNQEKIVKKGIATTLRQTSLSTYVSSSKLPRKVASKSKSRSKK